MHRRTAKKSQRAKNLHKKKTHRRRRLRKIQSAGNSIWLDLVKSHNFLCRKILPKPEEILNDTCIKYKNKWVNFRYDMAKVTPENSPLRIFSEATAAVNNYDHITGGVHNFILFWDTAANQYTLVTSMFNAIEFGSKHNMLAQRTLRLTPDKFLISGELFKEGPNIDFHVISSQYFYNKCNLITNMALIYLDNYILKENPSAKVTGPSSTGASFTDSISTDIKRKLIGKRENPNFSKPDLVASIEATTTIEELRTLLTPAEGNDYVFSPLSKSIMFEKYIEILTNGMQDAFNKLFIGGSSASASTGRSTSASKSKSVPLGPIKLTYVPKFDEDHYGEQKFVGKFIKEQCERAPATSFEVYDAYAACQEPDIIKREKKKLKDDSCRIQAQASATSAATSAKSTKKTNTVKDLKAALEELGDYKTDGTKDDLMLRLDYAKQTAEGLP